MFTPGYAAQTQFATQQSQQPVVSPGQPSYYGQHQEPQYANGPSQGADYNPAMGQLAGQFGQMGLGQQRFQLLTTNLLTSPPDPNELNRPPPEIRLPPNSCVSQNPSANSHPSYQRCTLNAIPTTSSLLAKSKIPLALVITPYRSVKEGEEQVPLMSDMVIPRCRRCRGYMSPFVQFVDGGNRYL